MQADAGDLQDLVLSVTPRLRTRKMCGTAFGHASSTRAALLKVNTATVTTDMTKT